MIKSRTRFACRGTEIATRFVVRGTLLWVFLSISSGCITANLWRSLPEDSHEFSVRLEGSPETPEGHELFATFQQVNRYEDGVYCLSIDAADAGALASFSDEELGRIGRLDAESTSSTGC